MMAVVWDIRHSAQVPRFSNQLRNKDLNIEQLETVCVYVCVRACMPACMCTCMCVCMPVFVILNLPVFVILNLII